jgi:hypothetical protein
MNVLDAVELINRVKFRDWIIMARYDQRFGHVAIDLMYRAADSCGESVKLMGVMQATHLAAVELHSMGGIEVLARVRAEIHKLVAHEVDEVLSIDGARPWNPHRSEDEQRSLLDVLFKKEK